MDRLLAVSAGVGQPLRSTDLDFVQDISQQQLTAILKAILPDTSPFILIGVALSGEGTGTITISAGYIFVDDEIYYIPTASFTEDAQKIVFFAQEITTGENRTFKDSSTHDVYQYRRYTAGYETTVPGGAISLSDLFALDTLLKDNVLAGIDSDLAQFDQLSYLTGFTPATAFQKLSLQGNDLNCYMLQAAFNATASAGRLATLPIGMRPTGDLLGFFFNGSVAPGILKIKSNGDIYVSGARTSGGANYISFQFFMRFEDRVAYGLPTSGGAAPPDGDPG